MGSKRPRTKKQKLISVIIMLTVIVLLVGFRLIEELGQEQSVNERFRVIRVIDGDTVELTGGDQVRLLAVDTPEEGEPFYEEAKQFLDSLLTGKIVDLEFAARRRDKYGRLLAYLLIDSLYINREIIRNGFGYVYLFKDNDLMSDRIATIIVAQKEAFNDKLGLWSIKRLPEKFYLATQAGFRLHRPECRSLTKPKPGNYRMFPNREEGLLSGLSPCRNCRP